MKKTLFYSSPIRYVSVSYLKILNQVMLGLCLAISGTEEEPQSDV